MIVYIDIFLSSKQLRLIKIIIVLFSIICKDNINLPVLNFIFSKNTLNKIYLKHFCDPYL